MGEVHLSFITSYDPSHSFLAPFNLHRQVLGVLGLSTLNHLSSMDELEYSPGALRQLHPNAVVHRVFAFDTGAIRPQTVDLSSLNNPAEAIEKAGQQSEETTLTNSSPTPSTGFAGQKTSGLVVFPAVRKDRKDVRFYLKTLLPDFVSTLLDGLDTTVTSLQGKPLETPRETLDGLMNSSAPLSPTSGKMIGGTVLAGSAVGTAASRASSLFSSFSTEEKKPSRNNKSSHQSMSSIGPMGAGRYAKIRADYYLLVGDLWNALHTYDSCMNLLGKERAMAGGQDAVWYASALEGWAVARFLVMRMGGIIQERATCLTLPLGGVKEKEKEKEKDKVEFQFHGKIWSDIAEAYSLALTIYTKCLAPLTYLQEGWKSITPDMPRDYTHPLIHTSACLAYSRFLLAIWASGGWNGETCDQLLFGGIPPALAETTRPTLAVYTQHCTASGVQRGDIAAPASLSMTNSSTNGIKLLDQIHLFSSLASLFGSIGFARKEAYTIRRLQALVVSLIVSGIELEKKETSTTSQVLRTSAEESQAFGTMTTTTFSIGAGENADSILVLALQIAQTYGIDITKTLLFNLDKRHILSRAASEVKSGKRLSSPLLNRGRASWSQNMSSIEKTEWEKFANEEQPDFAGLRQIPHFGWIQQQILILKDALGVCEVLQDDHSLLFFASILLRDFWSFLSAEDQRKLKDGIAKVQGSLSSKGQEVLLEYWGPALILDDLQILNQADNVYQMSIRKANEVKRDTFTSAEKKTPIKKPLESQSPIVLIDDEVVSFSVTLFNPLSVELEVERIQLDIVKASSIGPNFEAAEVTNLVIPPNSYHTIRLIGKCHGEGKLLLRGVSLKLFSCKERNFALERIDGENFKMLTKLQSDSDDLWTRIKNFGLEARQQFNAQSIIATKPKSRPEERYTPLQVIAKVPRLLIHSTSSLRNGNLVLFDGEERLIHLSLQNKSHLPIDYLRFYFEDDLKTEMLTLLAEGQLDPVHMHELEEDLLNRPFLWIEDEELKWSLSVAAGENKTFTFKVRGKLDVCRACIKIEYGNIKSAKELGRDTFWTRKAELRFEVRIQPIVIVDGLQASMERKGAEERDGESEADSIRLGLKVRNLHNSSITVDWHCHATTLHQSIPANTNTHLYFILPKLTLSKKYLLQPIPNLIERQFIVSKTKQTVEENRLVKMRFWTRVAFLKLIQTGQWKDDRSGKVGEINLSGLQFYDDEILSMLRREEVLISTRFNSESFSKYDFVQLIATVQNASEESLYGQYQLIADVNERLMNHIQCTDGHLHGPFNGLASGKSSEVQIGLCFLASGTFTFIFRIVQEDIIIAEKKVQVIVL